MHEQGASWHCSSQKGDERLAHYTTHSLGHARTLELFFPGDSGFFRQLKPFTAQSGTLLDSTSVKYTRTL
jgi:hypothetical protein